MHFKVVSSFLLCVGVASTVAGQSRQKPPDTTDRLRSLEESVSRLDAKISELTSLLRAVLPAPATDQLNTVLNVSMNRARGNVEAKVAVIEYSDFECPFCGRHALSAYQDIQRQFIGTGKVKYIFRHLPVDQLHPSARKAAEAAECAGDQGKFWEFHDRLFANQKSLSSRALADHARALNLNESMFAECLSEGKTADRVAADVASAKQLGLTGTPVFLFGETQKDGTVRVTRKVLGAQPYQVFEAVLNELLAKSDVNVK